MGTDTMRAVRAMLKSASTVPDDAERTQFDVLLHTTGAKRAARAEKTARHLHLVKDPK